MLNFIKNKLNIFDKKKNKKEENDFKSSNPIFRYILGQSEKNSSENTFSFVKKILFLIEKHDIKKLRELCLSGLPDEIPFLRSLIWKINLGYLTSDMNDWDNILRNKREEYNYLKKAFSIKLDLEKKIYEENIKRKQSKDSINIAKNIEDSGEDKKIAYKRSRISSEEEAQSYKNRLYTLNMNENPIVIERSKSLHYNNRSSVYKKMNHVNLNKYDNNNLYSKIENVIHRFSLKNTEGNPNSLPKNEKKNQNTSCEKKINDKAALEITDQRTIISNKDRGLIEDIYKDMRRTYSDFQFFLRPSSKKANQINDKDIENIIKRKSFNISCLGFHTVVKELNMEETHLDVISRILFIYSKTNNELEYVQGMNEICALIYYVIVQEEDIKNYINNVHEIPVNQNLISEIKISTNNFKAECAKISEEDLDYEEFHSATDLNLHSNSSNPKEFLNFEDFILHYENSSKFGLIDKRNNNNINNQTNLNRENLNKYKNNNNLEVVLGTQSDFKVNSNFVLKTQVENSSKNKSINEKRIDKQTNLSEFFRTDYEADTYWCFSSLMDMIKFTYKKSEDDKDRGLFKKVYLLKLALKSFDPNLYKLIEDKKIDVGIFSMRWFILLFCQDFTLPDVIRIWDILLFIEDDTDIFYKVYIFALAILSLKKHYLHKVDFVSFIMEMQNLYDINIETLIDTYTSIHKSFSKKLKKILK